MTLPTDVRGTPIEVGKIVAYNVSGRVALGKVWDLKPSFRHGSHRWTISVELLHRAAGQWPGHMSKVRDPQNLLVLLKGDSPT